MDFKEILQADIDNVFLDTSEFAEMHIINGREMAAIIDDNTLNDTTVKIYGTSQSRGDGLFCGDIVVYVSTKDINKPPPGSTLNVDGQRHIVISVSEQSGLYKFTIRRTGAR